MHTVRVRATHGGRTHLSFGGCPSLRDADLGGRGFLFAVLLQLLRSLHSWALRCRHCRVAVWMSREGPAQQGVYPTHLTCVASLQAGGKVQISSMHVGGNKINAQNTHIFTKIVCDDSDIRIELRHEMMGRSRPCFNTCYRLLLLLVMLQEYGAVCFRPVSFKRVCCICSHASQRAGQLC